MRKVRFRARGHAVVFTDVGAKDKKTGKSGSIKIESNKGRIRGGQVARAAQKFQYIKNWKFLKPEKHPKRWENSGFLETFWGQKKSHLVQNYKINTGSDVTFSKCLAVCENHCGGSIRNW